MIATQRLEKIKEILLIEKTVSIHKLRSIMSVSDVTIRKDLSELEKQGFLIKTRGGATLAESSNEEITQAPTILNYDLKEYIATIAANTIEDGDSIFLGSGATCYLLAKKLKHKDVTIITNNISALYELTPHLKRVFLIGGELVYRENMISSSSEKVDDYFKDIYVNKAFTSISGIDLMAGLTVDHTLSTFVYKQVPNITQCWTLLADHMKFNKIALFQVGTIATPDRIITNQIDDVYKNAFLEKDVEVITK
ncbi:DeoR/GlpR family DNA-binding transcription regulator [Crassaminicella profunda]|uniref:DeoR/GlpR family DNA-binding transcription regulator n=1 Tax=Crassaminicella profunda TaxID=1286698 RepID=UPI001CA61E88|nr:DeoR/GlpR family DNA-binding transcription regulator [Crassaminicella profunda]QZY55639.1 DeoR/GlpR family DNA-binding transcription regulator [Crassaminicella profunda]